jgi:hypothetical protein
MIAILLFLAQDVEVEGIDLVPNVLMIQEKLGQVTEILGIDLLLLGIELKHGQSFIPIDLVSWWASDIAARRMILELNLLMEEVQAEGTRIENTSMILRWIVSVIPSLHRYLSKLDILDRFEPCSEHKITQFFLIHSHMLVVVQKCLLLLFLFLFSALGLFE